MLWLLDTSIIIRALSRAEPHHVLTWQALRLLRMRADGFAATLQVLAEFWGVSTRPASARGGLGLTSADADRRLRIAERHLVFLPDTDDVRVQWRRLRGRGK